MRRVAMISIPDSAPVSAEASMLALVFEALLSMPAEYWIAPGDPGEYSGELLKANDEEKQLHAELQDETGDAGMVEAHPGN
jgi:hypothetical protein